MAVTNTDNQAISLKKRIRKLNKISQPFREKGYCPTKDFLAGSTDKWSLLCIYNLAYFEQMRFNELKNAINDISARMLSLTLKKLEQNKIVIREVFPESPPRVEYSLTNFGLELADRLSVLTNWIIENSERLKEME
ncbi:MAG: helix-turn-helix domain-containing protein [Bacteroidota bacterium]